MNDKKIKVTIEWQLSKINNLPQGLQYITVAKFDENWKEDTWSIVLEFDQPPIDQGNPSIGYARFLMPYGPKDKLLQGAKFELYEGNNLSAKVSVL